MKKISSRLSNICSKPLKFRLILLCKIFVIWLLLQFFLQTFITFKLGRDGKFWTLFWMWKEFILLIFIITLLRYTIVNLKWRISAVKNKENTDKITRQLLLKNTQSKFIIQFIILFVVTTLVFLVLAVWIQHVWFKAFILSAKYDLFWFFIFWIWICLSYLLCDYIYWFHQYIFLSLGI